MALTTGARLGPYEIVAPLGAGGMGEVYRARDAKLNRDVALKILPDSVAQDTDRVARFKREAQVLASLNHPHIAAIYGFDESDGTQFLVLELVEGDTLADRIKRGPIPVDETIAIARQIAEALAEAHEKGIIHRDLKPANIALSGDDQVKVLDFGLAKLTAAPGGSASPSVSMSPTLTTPAMMTGVGMILGTAAYMSPEQAKGREADKRCDVWAFGCVVYEMLTAKRVFEGEDITDTIASIMRGEPDWSALPADTPANLRLLLESCLTKDRKQRAADIAVVQFLLGGRAIAPSVPAASHIALRTHVWRRALPIAIGVLLTAALTSAAWWRGRSEPAPAIVTRFSLTLPEGQDFTNTGRQVVAISPDGTQIAYVANQRLYLRAMSDPAARSIAGDDKDAIINPVFSPDGQSIAFFSAGDRTLKRIARTGGTGVRIGSIGSFAAPFGMSWGEDGILFGQAGSVMHLSPNGGAPDVLFETKTDELVHGPQMLPGGKAVLFTVAKAAGADRWEKAQIVVRSLASGDRKILIESASDARYLPTGHLVYAQQGVIFAVPFDVHRLEVSGGPVAIIEGVRRAGSSQTGTAQFSVAGNGSLVYIAGRVQTNSATRGLALIDRKGAIETLKIPPGGIDHPRVSPDGNRVVFITDDEKETVVWTYELSGATTMRRVTFSGRNRFPIWSSDGQRVAFQSDREGDLGIFWQRADGAGTTERLTTAEKETAHVPESWSPTNDGFLFRVTKGPTSTLSFYSLKDKTATPFGGVQSASPTNAVFSPDGRWVAYEANGAATDGTVVYVQPFPATGARYQIPVFSQGGYRHPLWSPAGSELFYIIGGNVRLMVSGIVTRPAFAFGNAALIPKPSTWLDSFSDLARSYDITPDGQRFIARIQADAAAGQTDAGRRPEIQVVVNWFTELRARVPTK